MRYVEYAKKLTLHFEKNKAFITSIHDISQLFDCSERHTKTILNYFHQHQIIHWATQKGRGKKPIITLAINHDDLQLKLAIQAAENEEYQKAYQLVKGLNLNVRRKFQKWLQVHTGFLNQLQDKGEALDILRYPYYETNLMLDPIKIQSRHDAHIVQQIYDGLVEFDIIENKLVPKIAHHWQTKDGLKWTFYIRKNVLFHHGKKLKTSDIQNTIERININDQLRQMIQKIEIIDSYTIVFLLNEVNFLFPRYLANSKLSIIPEDIDNQDLKNNPVGTGPFHLAKNNENIIQLKVFEDYYGLRPWLDRIDIIKVPVTLTNDEEFPLNLKSPDNSWKKVSMQEEGADFILFNTQKEGPLQDKQFRQKIYHHIDPREFCLPEEKVARSFLTSRSQQNTPVAKQQDKLYFSQPIELKIGVQEIRKGANHRREALILQQQLSRIGINSIIETIHFHQPGSADQLLACDLFVGGIALSDDRLLSVISAFQSNEIGIYPLLNKEMKETVDERIAMIKSNRDETFQWHTYFAIEDCLVEHCTILFLNHRMHTIYEARDSMYQEISLSSNGRVDYRKVWKK